MSGRKEKKLRVTLPFLLSLGLLALLLILLPQGSLAEEIVVDESGNGDYLDLPPAVDNAANGDTILIREGNYTAVYTLQKSLTILGAGPERTRLNFTINWILGLQRSDTLISGVNFSAPEEFYNSGVSLSGSATNCSLVNCSFFGLKGDVVVLRPNTIPSRNISVVNCSFQDCILEIEDSDLGYKQNLKIENNTVNKKPLRYLRDRSGESYPGPGGGFFLVNCSRITIEGTGNGEFGNGIRIWSSENITLSKAQVVSTTDSIQVSNSSNINILNCLARETRPEAYPSAIYCYEVFNSRISGNTVVNSSLNTDFCENIEIRDNVITGRAQSESRSHIPYAIDIRICRNMTIIGNSVEEDGLIFQRNVGSLFDKTEYYYHTVENNTVDGRPIYYFRDRTSFTVPKDAAQFFLVNCSEVTVRNLNISEVFVAGTLVDTRNCLIQDCHLSKNGAGLTLIDSPNNRIESCEFLTEGGIDLYNSSESLVMNCSFHDDIGNWFSTTAIYVSSGENVRILNNTISEAYMGIFIQGTQGTLVEGNTITSCWQTGIKVRQLQKGHNTTIHFNNISGNRGNGLEHTLWPPEEKLDARWNWWGNETGPLHMEDNPEGVGDEVEGNVDFSEWLRDSNPETWNSDSSGEESGDDDDLFSPTSISFLVLLLALILLALMVKLGKIPFVFAESERNTTPDPSPNDGEQGSLHKETVTSCPHCGKDFDITTVKRPMKFNCHFCHREIELE